MEKVTDNNHVADIRRYKFHGVVMRSGFPPLIYVTERTGFFECVADRSGPVFSSVTDRSGADIRLLGKSRIITERISAALQKSRVIAERMSVARFLVHRAVYLTPSSKSYKTAAFPYGAPYVRGNSPLKNENTLNREKWYGYPRVNTQKKKKRKTKRYALLATAGGYETITFFAFAQTLLLWRPTPSTKEGGTVHSHVCERCARREKKS